jgi:hypothetical protein
MSEENLLTFTQIATDDTTLIKDSAALKSFVESYGLAGRHEVPLEGIEKFFI